MVKRADTATEGDMNIAYLSVWDLHTLYFLLKEELVRPPEKLLHRIECEFDLVDGRPLFHSPSTHDEQDAACWENWKFIDEESRVVNNTIIALELTDAEYDLITRLVLETCSMDQNGNPYPRGHSYSQLWMTILEAGRHFNGTFNISDLMGEDNL